jgi:hypothetical protein
MYHVKVNTGRIKVESITMENAKRYILKDIPNFLQNPYNKNNQMH